MSAHNFPRGWGGQLFLLNANARVQCSGLDQRKTWVEKIDLEGGRGKTGQKQLGVIRELGGKGKIRKCSRGQKGSECGGR